MSALSRLAQLLCYLSVAVSILSLFLPQKRTRKIFSFVIGLFVICSLIQCVRSTSLNMEGGLVDISELSVPDSGDPDYNDAVMQTTAENLISALDELLRSEGVEIRDIRLSLKISNKGRIYAEDVVIYISESDLPRKREIENIVYRNLSKEPAVYVEKEEVE